MLKKRKLIKYKGLLTEYRNARIDNIDRLSELCKTIAECQQKEDTLNVETALTELEYLSMINENLTALIEKLEMKINQLKGTDITTESL